MAYISSVRDAIARGLIPGPRLFVATKVLASTGSYEPRTENAANGVCLPQGGEAVDGPEEARKAVRRRIAEGIHGSIGCYIYNSYNPCPTNPFFYFPIQVPMSLSSLLTIDVESNVSRRHSSIRTYTV